MILFGKKHQSNFRPIIREKNDWFLFIFWFSFYASIFVIFFAEAASNLDPDFGWHLRIGQEIATENQISSVESITYPTLGQTWVDHEWLFNYLVFQLFSFGGRFGNWLVSFVFTSLVIACFIILQKALTKHLRSKSSHLKFSLFVSISILLALYPIFIFFGNRPQVLSWFFLIICFYLFFDICQRKKYALLLIFPPLFVLWANLHGSFVFGLGLMTCFNFLIFLDSSKPKQKALIVVVGLISFFATLLTPYHIELWKLVVGEYLTNRSYLSQIAEWTPIYAKPKVLLIPSLFVALFVALLIMAWSKKIFPKNKYFYAYLAYVVLLLIVAVKSRRFLPIFAFSSIPIFTFFLENLLSKISVKKSFLAILLIFTFVLSGYFFLHKHPLPIDIFQEQSALSPYEATKFLKENEDLRNLKIFNAYEWGGYLSWVWQDKQIFIDGRMPQKQLKNGTIFFEEYLNFKKNDLLDSKLKEYEIEIVIVPKPVFFRYESIGQKLIYEKLFLLNEDDFNPEDHLLNHLSHNWEKIYQDEICLIYKKANKLRF